MSAPRPLTVRQLVEAKGESLGLELVAGGCGLDRVIHGPEISNPGLVLTGFVERFPGDRLQVLGETEIAYLAAFDEDGQRRALNHLFRFSLPAIFVTKSLAIPTPLIDLAEQHCTPVFRSRLRTAEFYTRIKPFLEDWFAPRAVLHGSLADVYGVGLLFVGPSGIGKSEAVLDLVERGHRLVADDLVVVTRRGTEVLLGRGHELQQHHMEIRGVGIIDIAHLFGIRAIRQQKRIEVVVQLERWDEAAVYDRTGLDRQTTEILGVTLPKVVVPLNPGKNITVIAEVVAMNHLLRYSGIDSAVLFNERLKQRLRRTAEYLEEDTE